MTYRLVVSPLARADIIDILEWSIDHFGSEVRDGYEELIRATIELILLEPSQAGSRARSDLEDGVRSLHLMQGRARVRAGARRIAKPRHFIVYRQVGDAVHIARVLHETMDLPQHRLR